MAFPEFWREGPLTEIVSLVVFPEFCLKGPLITGVWLAPCPEFCREGAALMESVSALLRASLVSFPEFCREGPLIDRVSALERMSSSASLTEIASLKEDPFDGFRTMARDS